MSRLRLSLSIALAFGVLAFAGSSLRAEPCAIGLNVHNHAWILFHHHRLASCASGPGCKCVSCWNLDGSVSSMCFPLVAPVPR